jgi:hypothetical protein
MTANCFYDIGVLFRSETEFIFIFHAIDPADKYITPVIPAKAGIQRYYWMPDQVRHDGFRLFSRRVNIEY